MLIGKLRPMLIKAGALKSDQNKELGSGSVRPSSSTTSEEEYVVSKVVLRNQKMSSPSDVFVSTTVTANMIKALSFSSKNPDQLSAFADDSSSIVDQLQAEAKVEAVVEKPAPVVAVTEPVKAEVKEEEKVEAVVEKPAPVVAVAEPVQAEVKVKAPSAVEVVVAVAVPEAVIDAAASSLHPDSSDVAAVIAEPSLLVEELCPVEEDCEL